MKHSIVISELQYFDSVWFIIINLFTLLYYIILNINIYEITFWACICWNVSEWNACDYKRV
jgi:hypothetical protein